MMVWSPILTTTPYPLPPVQSVPKNTRFAVSRGLSALVHSTFLSYGSDSPVKLELSTFKLLEKRILKSAGIFCPYFTSTTSPGTSFWAIICFLTPSLITLQLSGKKFLNAAIMDSDF